MKYLDGKGQSKEFSCNQGKKNYVKSNYGYLFNKEIQSHKLITTQSYLTEAQLQAKKEKKKTKTSW